MSTSGAGNGLKTYGILEQLLLLINILKMMVVIAIILISQILTKPVYLMTIKA